MKQIAIFSAQLPPTPCGVGDFALKLSERLSSNYVVSLMGFGEQAVEGSTGNVRVGRSVKGCFEIKNYLKRQGIGIAVVQFTPWMYRWLGLEAIWICLAVKLASCRLVVHAHELYAPWDSRKLRYAVRFVVHRLVWTICFFLADKVIVSMQKEMEINRRTWPFLKRRVLYLATPSSIDFCSVDESEKQSTLEKYGLSRFSFLCIVFGLSHNLKHRLDLVLSVAKKFEPHSEIAFAVVGASSKDCEGLRAEHSNVFWLGYLDERSVSILMQCAHLMVAPFRLGMSTKNSTVMTAFKHRLAVLSTYGAETDCDLIDKGVACLTPYEETAFVEAAEQLRKNQEMRQQLALKGHEFYEKLCSFDKVTQVYSEIFESLSKG